VTKLLYYILNFFEFKLFEEWLFELFFKLDDVRLIFIFFIKITNIKPITNSKPPKPSIKNVNDTAFISFMCEPTITEMT